MMKGGEEWRPVKDYEGIYEVSNYGRVRSLIKVNNQLKFTIRDEPLIRKSHLNQDGYPELCMTKNTKQRTLSIHRMVAIAFIDNPENKPEVNHIDGDKANNYFKNLEWVTRSQNVKHAYDTCNKPKLVGELGGQSKLTNKQAVEIVKSKELVSKLAKNTG